MIKKLFTVIKIILCSQLLLLACKLNAQPLPIISTKAQYISSIKISDKNEMINLKRLIPSILIDLKYACTNNFTDLQLYKSATTTYLRKDAAMALLSVQQNLKCVGFGLKIFDAYRPYAITKMMWELIKDERYVANPKNGSGHNRGISIDVTIVNLATNTELDMGTLFDDFSENAHHSHTNKLDATVAANRILLRSTMEKFGFNSLETEWWHYSWKSTTVYDVLNINFKTMRKLID